MRTCLGMDRDVVASRLGKGFEIRIARRNHQMGVENLFGVRAHRLDDVGTIGNVGDEMAVHHVEMDPVGAGGIDGAHLFAEFGKVGRQDRRRNHEGTGDEGSGHWRCLSKAVSMREKRFFGLTCESPAGNAGGKICRQRHQLPIGGRVLQLRTLSFY